MSNDRKSSAWEVMEREKARLLAEAASKATEAAEAAAKAAAIARDMAEFDRIAAKYNLTESQPRPKQSVPVQAEIEASPGTVGELVEKYRTDERSPYKKLRFKTREHYDNIIKKLLVDCRSLKVADLKAEDILRLHDGWTEGGTKKLSMAHALITMFRILANFGATKLGDLACDRLSVVLHRTHFTSLKPRNKRLTKEHALLIIEKAHEMGLHSIALAQAIQFDCKLSQKDVIGEWVPMNEPGPPSAVLDDNNKWLRGIRWEEIDSGWVLRHLASSDGILVEVPLRKAALVSKEFERLGELPKRGPIIVSEKSGLPWRPTEFRRHWRLIARACGIPDDVKNMDSRASAHNKGANETNWGAEAEASTPR